MLQFIHMFPNHFCYTVPTYTEEEKLMLEFLIIVLFCWLAFKVIGLAFKVAWGPAKIIASILLVLAVPMLIVCLLFAGGMILLAPVALIGIAFALLKKCVI